MGGVCGFQGLSLSEAALAGKEGRPVKGCADQKEEEEVEVVVAPASGEIKGKAEAAGCSKPVAVAGDAVEEAPAQKKRQTKLTMDEIAWILDQKPPPVSPPADKETLLKLYPPEMIDRVMEINLRVAKAMASAQKRFFTFQDRILKDLAEDGVVMVDDVSTDDDQSEEEFDRLDNEFSDSNSDSGNYPDMYATDEEEVEEEEEVALEGNRLDEQ